MQCNWLNRISLKILDFSFFYNFLDRKIGFSRIRAPFGALFSVNGWFFLLGSNVHGLFYLRFMAVAILKVSTYIKLV